MKLKTLKPRIGTLGTTLATAPQDASTERKAWAKRPDAPKRMTGRPLQRARARLFARHPLCELCEAAGRLTVATERDHRIPLALGGADDETNERALCHDCNEAERLRMLGHKRRPRIGLDGYPAEDE